MVIQINHKHGSIPKDSHKDTNTSGSVPPKYNFQHHQPKLYSVRFNDPYNSINTKDNTNESTPLVNSTNENLPEEEYKEGEKYFEYAHEPGTIE